MKRILGNPNDTTSAFVLRRSRGKRDPSSHYSYSFIRTSCDPPDSGGFPVSPDIFIIAKPQGALNGPILGLAEVSLLLDVSRKTARRKTEDGETGDEPTHVVSKAPCPQTPSHVISSLAKKKKKKTTSLTSKTIFKPLGKTRRRRMRDINHLLDRPVSQSKYSIVFNSAENRRKKSLKCHGKVLMNKACAWKNLIAITANRSTISCRLCIFIIH